MNNEEDPLHLEPKIIKKIKDDDKEYIFCEQCDYMATQVGHLRRHVRNKHEGLRFPCECTASTAGKCDKCE